MLPYFLYKSWKIIFTPYYRHKKIKESFLHVGNILNAGIDSEYYAHTDISSSL